MSGPWYSNHTMPTSKPNPGIAALLATISTILISLVVAFLVFILNFFVQSGQVADEVVDTPPLEFPN